MAHFALVNDSNIVEKVIVAEQRYVDILPIPEGYKWIQTSYNTRYGLHFGADGLPDGGTPLRKNFACIGMVYNPEIDAFHSPRPYKAWIFDPVSASWNPPMPQPEDALSGHAVYEWDDDNDTWIEVGRKSADWYSERMSKRN
jgi:hypothetical protein